ncbi:D-sedoheptulose 7-phosphate isomerase [Lachnoanaerobaculum sp. JCM 36186]|uniref:D-sedoheptulose-7-phosphate isomerase n=1 Tax=Lachnoanaerobaculum sanguinis TaxID=3065809 RepID=UPI002779AF2A|nr:SIS domain-containing protein [Lachnoanaerobaculum sp. JCM 36186]GMO02387.1 D-sedoheptulose 7-phosphate isomerase [Lachnoanaerobaculum sp. JCM 36186]
MEENIIKILDNLISRYPELDTAYDNIWNTYKILEEAYSSGRKLLVAGNGGSAADSEHIVGELMKGFVKPRKLEKEVCDKLKSIDEKLGTVLADNLQGALPSIAVTGHVGLSTAYLNDCNPLLSFAQQVNGFGREGDVFLGISTSGNSENILYALVTAKAKGMKTIGLSGRDGGKMKEFCDEIIIVPEKETFKIQELHLPVYHALCLMLEERFF